MIESPGEAAVGSVLTSAAVGCGSGVTVIDVIDSALEEQAVNMNSPIKLLKRTSGMFFMQETKIL